jgi:prolyl oligopeptidase
VKNSSSIARPQFRVSSLPIGIALAGWLSLFGCKSQQIAGGPPVAPVRTVTDTYFGTKVSDPYRYMEKLDDPEVAGWFKKQDDYTRSVLTAIPGRAALLAKLKEYDATGPARITDVQRYRGDRIYTLKRMADEDVAKLYVRTGLNGPEKLLVDPTKQTGPNGEKFTLTYSYPSYDGRYIAYGISPAGSEDAVIHILDTTTGRETGETIDRSWYGGVYWLDDGKSFYHVRFQKLEAGMDPAERRLKSRVYLHRVGTDAESDVAVFGYGVIDDIKLDPADSASVVTWPGDSTAYAVVSHGFSNDLTVYSAPIAMAGKTGAKWSKIVDPSDNVTDASLHHGDLFLTTHKGAPRSKVLKVSAAHPDIANATVLVPPGDVVVQNTIAMADALYVQELDGGIGKLLRIPYSGGAAKPIELPFDGSINLLGGDSRLDGIYFGLAGWTKAPKIFAYEPKSGRVTDTKLQPVGSYDDPADLESVEVKAPSYDGTNVPLSIVYKKGIPLDGSHPTLLTGYGAYAINMDPFFDPRTLAWLGRGGVLAVAHVRGGGEYGQEWHEAGMLKNKPNTWRDFIACAEFLVKNKYTSPAKLAGQGGSAGGILIGRAFTERPDLFAAILDDVGLSDMIRDMFSPDGPLNVPEYGGLNDKQGFENLLEISAYYHVKDGVQYPAVLVTTGMRDPRVVPWEPGKMAARLQATGSKRPILLRVDYQGGHGAIGGTRQQAEALYADQYAFLLWQFGETGFQIPATQ